MVSIYSDRQLLLGLASNGSACEVHLDISCNSLGSNGASLLESCLPEITCLQGLDISENGNDPYQLL